MSTAKEGRRKTGKNDTCGFSNICQKRKIKFKNMNDNMRPKSGSLGIITSSALSNVGCLGSFLKGFTASKQM